MFYKHLFCFNISNEHAITKCITVIERISMIVSMYAHSIVSHDYLPMGFSHFGSFVSPDVVGNAALEVAGFRNCCDVEADGVDLASSSTGSLAVWVIPLEMNVQFLS